jgi:hypothetical protein
MFMRRITLKKFLTATWTPPRPADLLASEKLFVISLSKLFAAEHSCCDAMR